MYIIYIIVKIYIFKVLMGGRNMKMRMKMAKKKIKEIELFNAQIKFEEALIE